MVHVEGVSKTYKIIRKNSGVLSSVRSLFIREYVYKKAVDHISFSMKTGEAMACIGQNGAGKSTLIKMLVGILTQTSGQIQVSGYSPQKHQREYLRKIGVIFGQRTNLWWDIPVIESYNAVKTLYDVENASFQKMFQIITSRLELTQILHIPARKLSLGQRMKADIGMIFLHQPQLLFLDEPTLGLDINIKQTIREFLKEMNQQEGTSILLTSHDLNDIEHICKSTIVLSNGKLIFHGSIENLTKKYATQKSAMVVGNKKADIHRIISGLSIKENGEIHSITYDGGSIKSSKLLTAINECYDIEDVSISGSDIEKVVSDIFRVNT